MSASVVEARSEPSATAWRRSGDIAARILENLAQRDARAAAANPPTGDVGNTGRGTVGTVAPARVESAA